MLFFVLLAFFISLNLSFDQVFSHEYQVELHVDQFTNRASGLVGLHEKIKASAVSCDCDFVFNSKSETALTEYNYFDTADKIFTQNRISISLRKKLVPKVEYCIVIKKRSDDYEIAHFDDTPKPSSSHVDAENKIEDNFWACPTTFDKGAQSGKVCQAEKIEITNVRDVEKYFPNVEAIVSDGDTPLYVLDGQHYWVYFNKYPETTLKGVVVGLSSEFKYSTLAGAQQGNVAPFIGELCYKVQPQDPSHDWVKTDVKQLKRGLKLFDSLADVIERPCTASRRLKFLNSTLFRGNKLRI